MEPERRLEAEQLAVIMGKPTSHPIAEAKDDGKEIKYPGFTCK